MVVKGFQCKEKVFDGVVKCSKAMEQSGEAMQECVAPIREGSKAKASRREVRCKRGKDQIPRRKHRVSSCQERAGRTSAGRPPLPGFHQQMMPQPHCCFPFSNGHHHVLPMPCTYNLSALTCHHQWEAPNVCRSMPPPVPHGAERAIIPVFQDANASACAPMLHRPPIYHHHHHHHHPKHGQVLVTERDGTTFYHYPKPLEIPMGSAQADDHTNVCSEKLLIAAQPKDETTAGSQVLSYSPTASFSSGESYKSNSSSRCSSPFPASTNSSTVTRDSGVTSIESTDEDAGSVLDECTKDQAYEKLLQLILYAAEFTLSDESLTKDSYLRRQVKRDSQGFVSVRLLASAKAIKKLTRDYKAIVLALHRSTKLELNAERTKVKRKSPMSAQLPPCRDNKPLLIANLPTSTTMEDVWLQFNVYGPIAQLRLLKPGQAVPHYLHGYLTALPQLGKVTCAVVEFENREGTNLALQDFKDRKNDVSVVLLGPKLKRNFRNAEKNKGKVYLFDQYHQVISSRRSSSTRHISDDSATDCDSGIYTDKEETGGDHSTEKNHLIEPFPHQIGRIALVSGYDERQETDDEELTTAISKQRLVESFHEPDTESL